MKNIISNIVRGKTLNCLVIVFAALAVVQSACAALPDASEAVDGILDLQGGTYTVSGDNAIANYSGLEFRNGTITFSGAVNQDLSSGFAGFTVGEGAVVTGGTSSASWYFSADNFNIAVTNGGKFCVAKDLTLGRQGGTSTLLLDGANFEVTGEFGLPICENTSSANNNRDYRCDVTITNSTLTLKDKTHVGYILSGVKNTIKSIESNVRVYDSTITAETWQTASGNDKGSVTDANAHMSTYFGHGTIIDVSKFYINRYRRPNASITFDGAIVRRHGTETGLFDQYQYNSANRYVTTGKGLTLDFNDDYTEGSSYAAGISGDGDVINRISLF